MIPSTYVKERNIKVLCPLLIRDEFRTGFLEAIRISERLLAEGLIEAVDYDWERYMDDKERGEMDAEACAL